MSEGLSTNRNCETMADCLAQAGKQFVVRYHSRTTTQPEKRLTPREAALLARAGLDLVTVYQDNARTPQDFGRERGLLDGRSAFAFAAQVGQPPGSAIYFAVDEDFSAAQIRAFVLPYFEGVAAGLDEAAGGMSAYRIGIYGSGLSCTLVRDDNELAQLAWLAMASGWRGSATFATWDMRQHASTQALCSLATGQWERNEARGDHGQFRPIGAELGAGDGVPMRVTAPELFLRRLPTTQDNVPIARMKEGQLVRVLGEAAPPWVRVRVSIAGNDAIGFASGRFLAPADAAVAPAAAPSAKPSAAPSAAPTAAPAPAAAVPAPTPALPALPAAHFRENDPASMRASSAKRAQPIGEAGRPTRDVDAAAETRRAQLDAIVDWLGAESSARYQRTEQTYCNVYAADFCYLAGAYLPRVWWKDSALLRIARGETPPVQYDTTVREMRADDLLAWLLDVGPAFGWQRVFDGSALQAAANAGGIGLICADRAAPGPGHITVVVPESAQAGAKRDADGNVVCPLQSQAGAENFRRKTTRNWWDDAIYRDRVFFVHA